MENLKYTYRNLTSFTYDYATSTRAICTSDVIFNIFEEAIRQQLTNYMFMFAYQGNLFSIDYQMQGNNTIVFSLVLPNGDKERFANMQDLKNYNLIAQINSPITILREYIPTLTSTLEEVPVESDPMLVNFLAKPNDANFNLNVSDSVSKLFGAKAKKEKQSKSKAPNSKGLPVWGKILLFCGLFFGTIFIIGVVEAMLGIL